MFGQACQIRPLIGVRLQIVELFLPVGIPDVAPAVATQGDIAAIKGSDHYPPSGAIRLAQQGNQGLAIQLTRALQPAKLHEGGIKVEQADRLVATRSPCGKLPGL